ncbi:sigma-70 family RNA polymerase sigma factor [Cellulophaga sp. L1A9]|uniref:sigma-70 family RNA polymerase sigma factor n=1 Tax=Cellulophaga sp. L1A9 TaxID=2686362 RepID=UPI00131DF4BE|nr:sigma-70 family RNA polymerase sigma factor [Cellulophaga sp. L1A9]
MDTLEYYGSKKGFNVFVASTFLDLTQFRKQNNQVLFNNLLLKDLYQVKRYITKRLATALTKGSLPKGKYKVDDFMDQLFIVVYDNFDEVKNKEDLHSWLFNKVNELLTETIIEEEFEDYFIKNIDDYSRPEWDEMEEKFSTDGGGDYVMIDELDDISYPKNDYVLNHVFVEDNKKELMDALDKELGEEALKRHTDMVLHYLPLAMRNVFELATEYQFSIREIAIIRNQSIAEVKALLEKARKNLEASLFNRYDLA